MSISVNNVTATTRIDVSNMSTESVLFYARAQIDQSQTNIDLYFAKQKKQQKLREKLSDLQEVIAGLKTPSSGKNVHMGSKSEILEERLKSIIAEDPAFGTELKQKLRDANVVSRTGDHFFKNYSAERLEGMTAAVDNSIKSIDSSAHLDMIQLQSELSTYNQKVQLFSNIVSSLSKGADAVVANTR